MSTLLGACLRDHNLEAGCGCERVRPRTDDSRKAEQLTDDLREGKNGGLNQEQKMLLRRHERSIRRGRVLW